MTKTYELMLVIAPNAEVTDASMKALTQKLLSDDATITDMTMLGKKLLAYPIKKHTEAQYVLVKFTHPRVSVHEIEKKVQLGSDVLRFLVRAL